MKQLYHFLQYISTTKINFLSFMTVNQQLITFSVVKRSVSWVGPGRHNSNDAFKYSSLQLVQLICFTLDRTRQVECLLFND